MKEIRARPYFCYFTQRLILHQLGGKVMLKPMERTVTIASGSVIRDTGEELEVAGFNLSINSNDPLGMGVTAWVNNREMYNKNIAQCRVDEDEFRAYARQIQDEMLAALASDDTEGVPGEV